MLIPLGCICVTHAQDVLKPCLNISNLLTGLEDLKNMEARLNATEKLVEELKQQNTGTVQGTSEHAC